MVNLLTILLALSVIFGIKAVWTSRLRVSARKQVVGPLARRLGWVMISLPLIAAVTTAACIVLLKLLGITENLAYVQGFVLGLVIVLLAAAYITNVIRKYGVPINTDAPLDWANVKSQPSAADFAFLSHRTTDTSDVPQVVPEHSDQPQPPTRL